MWGTSAPGWERIKAGSIRADPAGAAAPFARGRYDRAMSHPTAQPQSRPPLPPATGASSAGDADPAATRIVSRSTIFAGKKYTYENVVLRADDGSELHRQMVRHPGAVTILPLLDTPDGRRVVIINNERFAVARTLVELPAGTLEPDEDPSVSAVRELEEEIGYTSDDLRPLGAFYTTPGLTDEIMHTYAALNLRHVGQRLEADEKITVRIITPDEAFAMIDDGRMMDAKSMLALLLARRKGLL